MDCFRTELEKNGLPKYFWRERLYNTIEINFYNAFDAT